MLTIGPDLEMKPRHWCQQLCRAAALRLTAGRTHQLVLSLLISLLFSLPPQYSVTAQLLTTSVSKDDWGIVSAAAVRWGQVSLVRGAGGPRLAVYSLYETPARVPPWVAESVAPEFNGNCLLLDSFDGTTSGRASNRFAVFAKAPSNGNADIEPSEDGANALLFDYERGSEGFCGVRIELGDRDIARGVRSYLDARSFAFLMFRVRSAAPHVEVRVKLADANWEQKQDAVSLGMLGTLVQGGCVDTVWRNACVPLQGAPHDLDLRTLAQIVFEPTGIGKGTLELRDLRLCLSEEAQSTTTEVETPINEEHRGRAVWVWNTKDLLEDESKLAEFLDFCKGEEFSDVFLSFPFPQTDSIDIQKGLRAIIRSLGELGIRSHALIGDPGFVLSRNLPRVTNLLESISNFNASIPDSARFVGLHLDVEPYLLPGFGGKKKEEILDRYIALLEFVSEFCHHHGLSLEVDIPFWMDLPDEHDGIPPSIRSGDAVRLALRRIFDLCDVIVLMDYRTQVWGADGIVAHARHEVRLAAELGKKVSVGLETDEVADEEVVTFSGPPVQGIPRLATRERFVSIFSTPDSLRVWLVGPGSAGDFWKMLRHQGIPEMSVISWPQVRTVNVSAGTVSFAGSEPARLDTVEAALVKAFGSSSGFAGVAFHHYTSYRRLRGASGR